MPPVTNLPTMAELIKEVHATPGLALEVKRVPKEILDGWTTESKALALAGAVIATGGNSIEIGTWCGRGAIPMALAAKYKANTFVLCIDPYSTPASMEGQTGEHLEWWSKVDHEAILAKFYSNIEKFEVDEQVTLQRMESDSVKPMPCSVLSIDGNHGEQAIRDVARFAPHVKKGGFVFLDDLEWKGATGKSVLTSIIVLEALGFKECFRYKTADDDWGCWRKVK